MHILIDFSNDFTSVKIVTQGNFNNFFMIPRGNHFSTCMFTLAFLSMSIVYLYSFNFENYIPKRIHFHLGVFFFGSYELHARLKEKKNVLFGISICNTVISIRINDTSCHSEGYLIDDWEVWRTKLLRPHLQPQWCQMLFS